MYGGSTSPLKSLCLLLSFVAGWATTVSHYTLNSVSTSPNSSTLHTLPVFLRRWPETQHKCLFTAISGHVTHLTANLHAFPSLQPSHRQRLVVIFIDPSAKSSTASSCHLFKTIASVKSMAVSGIEEASRLDKQFPIPTTQSAEVCSFQFCMWTEKLWTSAEQAVILTGNTETGNRNKLTHVVTSLGKSCLFFVRETFVVCRLQARKGSKQVSPSVPFSIPFK